MSSAELINLAEATETRAADLRTRLQNAIAELHAVEAEARDLLAGRGLICGPDEAQYQDLCRRLNFSPKLLQSSSRRRELVRQRAIIAAELRGRGWTLRRIGTVLRRDHGTINNLLGKK